MRNFTTNVPKILDRKPSSEQIFSENFRWVPLYHVTRRPLHWASKNGDDKYIVIG